MLDSPSRHLWEAYWHPICHRSEVANPRDFVRIDVGGEEVVAFHDGKNIVVFDNLCPHRGARIFDGSFGNSAFLCRYHGWSYAKGKVFPGDKTALVGAEKPICLDTFATEWVGDFLFASRRPAHGLDEQLSELRNILERISVSCTARGDFNSYSFQADWRVAIENALEPYHVNAIHPETLATLALGEGENIMFGPNSLWVTQAGNSRLTRKLDRIGGFFDLMFQHKGYWSLYLFPFSMISSTYGYTYSMQHFFPSAKSEQCEFTSRLYTGRLKPNIDPEVMSAYFESAAKMNRQIFDEDHQVCQRVPFRSWSPHTPMVYNLSEEKLVHFRASYRRATGDVPDAMASLMKERGV